MLKNNLNYMIGVFDDEENLIKAAKKLKGLNVEIFDIYTPFPVHGLDDLLNIKRSRLPIICFVAASVGCILAFLFQHWVSVVDWPIIVGGKPHNSFPAFIPVAFEITVLVGALVTVAAFFWRAGLRPGAVARIPHSRCTDDKFAVAIECKDALLDQESIKDVFKSFDACEVHVKRGSQWN